MFKSKELKGRARALRLGGQSVREIANNLSLSKSTVARWTDDIDMVDSGLKRLLGRQQLKLFVEKKSRNRGLVRGSRTALINEGATWVSQVTMTKELEKIFCALLYWANGAKTTNYVSFVESDPKTVEVFMKLFRGGYGVSEKKFRAMVYMGAGQSESELRQFWSDVSRIGLGQFSRSYVREYTMGRKMEWGNFRVNYYDVRVVRELRAVYGSFADLVV